jgi:hypothetical protein
MNIFVEASDDLMRSSALPAHSMVPREDKIQPVTGTKVFVTHTLPILTPFTTIKKTKEVS